MARPKIVKPTKQQQQTAKARATDIATKGGAPAVKRTRVATAAGVTPAPAPTAVYRVRAAVPAPVISYFTNSELRTGLEFFSTGCCVLDQVMGGGFAFGRMSNIIGDKSTGKTLMAIEACVNARRKYPDVYIRYAEAEAAFDRLYAQAMGLPHDVDYASFMSQDKDGVLESDRTVEWVFEDITRTLEKLQGRPCVYIVDSLDSLSDRAELGRDMDQGSYGMQKAKKLSEMFRRLVGPMEDSRLCLIIISQIRDKINVSFGETKQRTGGHAMDFYATHCLWLAQTGMIKKTIDKVERVVGVDILAKCKKNKVGIAHRSCAFPLIFGYGIDDAMAAAMWLVENNLDDVLSEVGMSKAGFKLRIDRLRQKGGQEMADMRLALNTIILREWGALERKFLPAVGKY